MELREQTIKEMVRLLSEEQVITDENVIIENEGATVHNYEKAFGHKNPHQPLCVVNVKNKEEIKKVLTYCNENKIHVIARTGASSSEDQLLVIDDQTIIVDASATGYGKYDGNRRVRDAARPVGKTGQRKGTDHRTQPAVLPAGTPGRPCGHEKYRPVLHLLWRNRGYALRPGGNPAKRRDC